MAQADRSDTEEFHHRTTNGGGIPPSKLLRRLLDGVSRSDTAVTPDHVKQRTPGYVVPLPKLMKPFCRSCRPLNNCGSHWHRLSPLHPRW